MESDVIHALVCLGLNENECKDNLLLCLESADSSVLNASITALAFSMREDSIPHIVKLIDSSSNLDTRMTTLNALSLIGEEKSLGLIKEAMIDDDPKVAKRAAFLVDHSDRAQKVVFRDGTRINCYGVTILLSTLVFPRYNRM